MNRKFSSQLLIFLLIVSSVGALQAQNIRYKITGDQLRGGVCGDCFLCGGPDNVWELQLRDNGTSTGWSAWNKTANDDDCGWRNYSNSGWRGFTNSTYGRSVEVQLRAYEDDGGSWGGGNEGNCGTMATVSNPVITSINPCTSTQFEGTRTCSGALWGVRYSVYWEYNEAPTLSSQTPANQIKCSTVNATPLNITSNTDGGGRVMTRWYKWQISNTPNGPWSDIPSGANTVLNASATVAYTPYRISGTRYYRVQTTSNCSADFTSLTSISPVYTVTYAFVSTGAYSTAPLSYPFGTGDATPAIQSPICGAQIASSQLVTLNTIQSPTPGHVANASYSWSATDGSPTTGTASSLSWTSPVTLGPETISLTYDFGCPGPATVTCATTVSDPSCAFIYVAPAASGGANTATAGGPSNPCLTLTGTNGGLARAIATGSSHIKMLNGTYAETAIVDLVTDLTIEGGYSKTGSTWVKGSNSTTNITCSGTGVGSTAASQEHVMGFRSSSDNNWKLIDLRITTSAASGQTTSGRGKSNYGIYINASTGYEITRCNITSGAATAGSAGANGATGHTGSNGVRPNPASCGDGGRAGGCGGGRPSACGDGPNAANTNAWGNNGGVGGNGAGSPGNGGSASNGTAGVAGGGSGGSGGAFGTASTNAGGNCGTNGGNGSVPGNGGGYTTTAVNTTGINGGIAAVSHTLGTFYTPSGQGAQGGHGRAGGGGGGSGSTRGQSGSFISCVSNGGNGGSGGGQGGGGGEGGDGGWGGGGSFGIYVQGTYIAPVNTTIASATAASGGAGGTGGNGGAGGAGGISRSDCSSERGTPKAGGSGGSGARGGSGEDGADGLSAQVVSGTSTLAPSVAIPSSPTISITYNDNMKLCKNSVLTIARTVGTGNWTLPTNFDYVRYNQTATASQYAAGSVTPSDIYPTNNTAGYYDLQSGTLVFESYLDLEADNRTAPSVTVKATDGSNLLSNSICAGGSVLLNKTGSYGTVVDYRWEVFSGATAPNKSVFPSGSAVFSSNVASPEFGPFITAATYTVRYQEREQCCGWSIPVFATITVRPDPSAPTDITFSSPATGAAICVPQTITVSGASGGTNGITPYTYEYVYDNGGGFGSYSTPPSFASQEGENTVKVRIQEVALWGCDASGEYEEIITGNPVPVGQANPASQEICSGQTADVSFITSNTVAGTTFAWSRTNTTNVTGLAASGSGDISAALSLASGVTTAQTVTFTVTPTGPATTLCTGSSFTATVIVNPNPTVSPTNNGPICEGATLTLTGGGAAGTPGYTYDWTGPSAYTASGSPVSRSASTTAMAGTYTVTVTDSKGCTATNNTVATVVLDPTFSGQPSGNTICAGQSHSTSVNVANGTGISYQWQYSTNGTNWFSVGVNAPVAGFSYVGANSANLTINTSTAVTLSDQYRFRCSVGSGNGCNPNPLISNVVTLNVVPATINASHRTWTGMVSNDWLNPLNWDCGGVPNTTVDVIIPQAPRYPIITNGQIGECNTIDIDENGPPSTIIVEVQDGGTLKVDSP